MLQHMGMQYAIKLIIAMAAAAPIRVERMTHRGKQSTKLILPHWQTTLKESSRLGSADGAGPKSCRGLLKRLPQSNLEKSRSPKILTSTVPASSSSF